MHIGWRQRPKEIGGGEREEDYSRKIGIQAESNVGFGGKLSSLWQIRSKKAQVSQELAILKRRLGFGVGAGLDQVAGVQRRSVTMGVKDELALQGSTGVRPEASL
jgi:hypothetical protein